jgi:hypothetical protein
VWKEVSVVWLAGVAVGLNISEVVEFEKTVR